MTLFNNHTSDNIFQDFEQKFKPILYQKYPHLSTLHIDCYTVVQYNQQKNIPLIDGLCNDTFAYSIDVTNDGEQNKVFAAIVISPELCESFNFTEMEKMAAIGHEVGHIIHPFMRLLFLNYLEEPLKREFCDLINQGLEPKQAYATLRANHSVDFYKALEIFLRDNPTRTIYDVAE